jgi:hypothetical protein
LPISEYEKQQENDGWKIDIPELELQNEGWGGDQRMTRITHPTWA